jgi:hypothetical protein
LTLLIRFPAPVVILTSYTDIWITTGDTYFINISVNFFSPVFIVGCPVRLYIQLVSITYGWYSYNANISSKYTHKDHIQITGSQFLKTTPGVTPTAVHPHIFLNNLIHVHCYAGLEILLFILSYSLMYSNGPWESYFLCTVFLQLQDDFLRPEFYKQSWGGSSCRRAYRKHKILPQFSILVLYLHRLYSWENKIFNIHCIIKGWVFCPVWRIKHNFTQIIWYEYQWLMTLLKCTYNWEGELWNFLMG